MDDSFQGQEVPVLGLGSLLTLVLPRRKEALELPIIPPLDGEQIGGSVSSFSPPSLVPCLRRERRKWGQVLLWSH
jgi:hypothetical protein